MATKKAGKKASKARKQEIEVKIPDLGLTRSQISSLQKRFQSELVSSLGERTAAARIRIIIIRVIRTQ